jgi:hypothetical protein
MRAYKPTTAYTGMQAAAAGGVTLPKGALRYAITVRGDETDAELAALKVTPHPARVLTCP